MAALERWLTYYQPLFRGRFDFFRSADKPMREGWHQALALTGGRFWVRVHGGHNLRRRDSSAADGCDGQGGDSATPRRTRSGVLVGRADGRATVVTTFPWVEHQAGRRYTYELIAVGAGGAAESLDAPVLRLSFDDNGALVGPEPNPVCDLAVDALSDGRFRLRWAYDEANEEASPSTFQIFNGAGTPDTIDDTIVVATVPYQFRQGFFSWLSAGFAHDTHVCWAVRAVSAGGAAGGLSATVGHSARAALPPVPAGVRVGGQ